jgi:hypothetical protein
MFDTEFRVPVQSVYEPMVPDSAMSRYELVVDGEYYSGTRVRELTKTKESPKRALTDYPGREIAKELGRRVRRRLARMTSK